MSEAVNPYAAPAARVDDVGVNPEAEAIRREHINHEASVKAVGVLYYLGGAMMTIAAITGFAGAPNATGGALVMLLLLAYGAASLTAGWGVRAFRGWGRIFGIVLSVIGLLVVGIGVAMIGGK